MIACLSIPYFAAAVERRADSGLTERPLAIGGQPWEARPVYAFSQEVAHKGVEIGMSLRLVQVLSPASHFMPAAETRYSKVSGEVIDVLTDFSQLIEPQELWHPLAKSRQPLSAHGRALPARYCLDLEGLPEREALPFVQAMGQSVRQETNMDPAIGLARQKFTAQVAATVCNPSHALAVKAGAEAAFLASRALAFLPLEKEMARRLRLLGIYTLGQLAGLALPALQEQFGPEINPHYQLARGEVGEIVHAQAPGSVCRKRAAVRWPGGEFRGDQARGRSAGGRTGAPFTIAGLAGQKNPSAAGDGRWPAAAARSDLAPANSRRGGPGHGRPRADRWRTVSRRRYADKNRAPRPASGARRAADLVCGGGRFAAGPAHYRQHRRQVPQQRFLPTTNGRYVPSSAGKTFSPAGAR